MSVKLGNARYGGESKKNYFKLKDGRSTFRILPPMGNLADDGRWSVFYSIHYGYKNSEGKMRTFQSTEVKNRKTKMIDIPDAAKNRIMQLKSELEKAKASGNKEMEAKLFKLVGGQKPLYNLDSHHYMNVIDLQGNIGILKIRHKAKLALDAAIKQLRSEGKDPIGVNDGRFFNFDRSGSGLDTVYQVGVYKEILEVKDVGKVERDLVHSLTPEIIARLGIEASELDSLVIKPTAEEIQRIVTEGATAVDEILDRKYGKAKEGSSPSVLDDELPDEEETVDVAKTVETVEAKAESPKSAPVATTVQSGTQTTAQKVNDQSEDEFLKGLGL